MRIFYQDTNTNICTICGKKVDYTEFVQYKQGTHLNGCYWKFVGRVCSNCHKSVIAPIFKKFTQVWDTYEFETLEMNNHLLVEPENKRDENGQLRY